MNRISFLRADGAPLGEYLTAADTELHVDIPYGARYARVLGAPPPAPTPEPPPMPAGFHDHVLAWLQREVDVAATEVVRVAGDGTDWEGDTEGGFYASFGVDVEYVAGGVRKSRAVTGDDMEELWRWVVAGWRPPEAS